MDISPAATLAIFASVAVLLYGILWWLTRGLARLPKVIARSSIGLILLLPLGLGLFFGAQMQSRDTTVAPESGFQRDAGSPPRPAHRLEAERKTAAKPPAARPPGSEPPPPSAAPTAPRPRLGSPPPAANGAPPAPFPMSRC